jgi:ArsR family transcriptional regulator
MDIDQFHRISKALSDPRRFEILERIAAESELACAALTEQLPVSQATISHHLKELMYAGLVEARRDAKFGFYRLRRDVWTQYLTELRRRVSATRKTP